MPEEVPQEITARFRLTLDFDVSVSTEILQPYTDEDELDPEETTKLQAQRSLMKALLRPQYRYLLDDQQYYQDAVEHQRFSEDAEDVVNSVGVDLIRAWMVEIDVNDED